MGRAHTLKRNHGYGWLPYDYVLHSIAEDRWSPTSAQWVETGRFGL